MGYRSEVVFAVDSELAPFFTAVLAKSPEAERLCRDADQYQSGYEEDGDFFMYWNHIKWYDGYPAIQAFKQMVEKIVEKLDEEAYRWVCIGEEMDDNNDEGESLESV